MKARKNLAISVLVHLVIIGICMYFSLADQVNLKSPANDISEPEIFDFNVVYQTYFPISAYAQVIPGF